MHNYQELKIWQRAVDLSVTIYELTSSFPDTEKYNLILQMRKSVVSIASNIAEGSGRGTDKDFVRFLSIALGSSFELQTQLIISERLKIIDEEKFENIDGSIEELKKMIWGFKKSLAGNLASLRS